MKPRHRLILITLRLTALATSATVSTLTAQKRTHWERFTGPARRVISAAQEKAKLFNRNEVGTELLPWVLVSDEDSVAVQILKKMDVPPEVIRLQAATELAWAEDEIAVAEAKLTPRAKRVLELAVDEIDRMPDGPDDIGPEALLLGLLRQRQHVHSPT